MASDAAFSDLSERAQRFFAANRATYAPPPFRIDTSSSLSKSPDLREFAAHLEPINSIYSGLKFPVLGGQLAGEVRLGLHGSNNVWRARPDILVARMAAHDTAQCAMVLAVGSRFGCSWTGEFTPLFDSIGLMLEDAAVWGGLQGWSYVAFLDAATEHVLGVLGDLSRDSSASGDLSQWWFGEDIAVSVAPYLNPARGDNPRTTILVKSAHAVGRVRRELDGVGFGGIKLRDAALGCVPLLRNAT
ncbi:hypothetical protein [Actinoplanes sp. NPDC049316]|uniref:hypothetical protein n=1 Tax=Actinoplanes sp. NPDC049316 TaxID=3154727 RepID=UPI00341BF04E